LRNVSRIRIAASGTSRHAGIAGQYMIESLAGIPVEVDYASEFAYRKPLIGPNELTIAITQSGETADTLAALRVAIARGSRTAAITNVVESTIGREAECALDCYAGPEIAVASTKAFGAQLTVLWLLAMCLAQLRNNIDPEEARRQIEELKRIPAKIETVLGLEPQIRDIAERFSLANDFLFLARGVHYPVALDGALKLKEVSYVHAEGYPAGEMPHGPKALIDENLPVVFLITRDPADPDSIVRYEKTLGNLKEVKARSGKVIAVACEGDEQVSRLADHVIPLPPAPELLMPIVEIVPLQLLAYYVAVIRGLDVDRPRNLAKAVLQE
jgi:glucosamine--fructose-6-phosphate aminotransferase (isomerizing)